jgi:hypothetical protein
MTRQTVGAASLKAKADSQVYDPLELGYALTDKVVENLFECAKEHEKIFDEPEFFVVLQRASDPLIKGVMRQKFYGDLYLPDPRPEQSVYIYFKSTQKMRRLWSLPSAKVMAIISEMPFVSKQWQRTKVWCDAFFNKKFWEQIRYENGFNHLSRYEYINLHRDELVKAGANDSLTGASKPFDFGKIQIEHIVDTKTALV